MLCFCRGRLCCQRPDRSSPLWDFLKDNVATPSRHASTGGGYGGGAKPLLLPGESDTLRSTGDGGAPGVARNQNRGEPEKDNRVNLRTYRWSQFHGEEQLISLPW